MKVVSLTILVALTFLFSVNVKAAVPKVEVRPPSAWIDISPWSSINETEVTGPIRYILIDDQVNLTTAKKQRYARLTSKVISEQGLSDISEIQVGFSGDYETLIFHNADVVRDGKIVKTLEPASIKVFQQETELQDNIYSEQWTALIILEDVRINDVVDFSYTVVGSNPVFSSQHFGSNYLEWSAPIDASKFRLLSNTRDNIRVKIHDTELVPIIKKGTQITETIVEQLALKSVREEDYTPSWYSQYAHISYSEFLEWEDVNNWALPLYQSNQQLDPELIEIIDAFKRDKSQDHVTQSIQWIQDNIRYFGVEWGINSHAPSSPNESFRRRYGDCKDKAVLMIAVLNYLGIEAYPALVSVSQSKSIPDMLPSPGAFDHVIVTFFVDNNQYWVDATVSNQRGHYANMSFPDFHYALVVQQDSDKLTPISPVDVSVLTANLRVEQQFFLNGSGKDDELRIQTIYEGWQADSARSYFLQVGLSGATTSHHDYITRFFPNAMIKEPLNVSDDPINNRVVVTQRYSALEFAESIEGNMHLSTYAEDIIDSLLLPSVRQRKTPFTLPYFVDINVSTRIDISNVEDVLWLDEGEYVVSENDWLDYSRSVKREENLAVIEHQYRSKQDLVEPAEFASYAKLLGEIEQKLSFSLVYKKERQFKDNDARARNLIQNLMKKN